MDFKDENQNFEQDETMAQDEIMAQVVQNEEACPEPQTKKKKYTLIAIAVAAIILVAIFVFFRNKVIDVNMYTKYTASDSKDLSYEDINGRFADKVNGMYFDFKAEKTQAEHVVETSADSSASSDASNPETKTVSYDGTCESGYTDEYVNEILSSIYIEQNDMTEEYEKYLQDNSLVIDDYSGFAKKNGVDQSDLDAIDATHSISQEAKSYIQHSFWNYNDKTKEITIYNQDGEKISAFKIFGNKLVASNGYFKGTTFKNKKFASVYTYTEKDYKETFYFYNDGNVVVKAQPGDETAQYYAGEYKSDESYVVITVGGQKMTYKKLPTGLSSIMLEK